MRALRSASLATMLFMLIAGTASASDIRIGVSGNYPPLSYVDANNRLEGFEIDLAKALCAQMKARCEFVQGDWNDLTPGLLANRFDAIMASMSITAQRKEIIDFSNRYYQTPASFTVRKASNIRDTSPKAMAGRLIGVTAGTIHEQYIADVYVPSGAKLKTYNTQQEAQLELERGRLDAVLTDKVGIYEWLANGAGGNCCDYAGEDVTDPKYIGEGVGIGLRKGDESLKDRFNAAIDAIVADGTYRKLNDKYFPFSVY
jgi:lysine-arginine-ornithine-binding protein